MGKVAGTVAAFVDFIPEKKLTAYLIQMYSNQHGHKTAQGMADEFASRTAAIAYMLRNTNTADMVRKLMNSCIDDAIKQYEHRQKVLQNGAASDKQGNANSNVAVEQSGDHEPGNQAGAPEGDTRRH